MSAGARTNEVTMKKLAVGMVGTILKLLAGCDAGPDASCSVCGEAFSDTQCMAFAEAYGCTSGERSTGDDPFCPAGDGTVGCQFHGCPDGTPVMCSFPATDGGTDSGM